MEMIPFWLLGRNIFLPVFRPVSESVGPSVSSLPPRGGILL